MKQVNILQLEIGVEEWSYLSDHRYVQLFNVILGSINAPQDKEAAKAKKKEQKTPEYKFFVEFQSHEPEFDYLKSLEIEEKINKIKWLNRNSNGHFLLTTNGEYWVPTFLWRLRLTNI